MIMSIKDLQVVLLFTLYDFIENQLEIVVYVYDVGYKIYIRP
jgi:hypothetical protein